MGMSIRDLDAYRASSPTKHHFEIILSGLYACPIKAKHHHHHHVHVQLLDRLNILEHVGSCLLHVMVESDRDLRDLALDLLRG